MSATPARRAAAVGATVVVALVVAVGAGCDCKAAACALDDVGTPVEHTIETGIAGASVAQSDVPDDFGCVVCAEASTRLTVFTVETPPTTPDEFRILFQQSDVPRDDIDIVGRYEHALEIGSYGICAGTVSDHREVGCVAVVIVEGEVQTLHAPGNHVRLAGGAAETMVNVENL